MSQPIVQVVLGPRQYQDLASYGMETLLADAGYGNGIRVISSKISLRS